MQPKPIEARHLLDIDAGNRLVEKVGIQHLRSVREHKEHPAETDYDVVHDEASRRNREETAKRLAEQMRKARAEQGKPSTSESEEIVPESEKNNPPEGQKGVHLDVEA